VKYVSFALVVQKFYKLNLHVQECLGWECLFMFDLDLF